jgi:hypothetical protein
VEYIRENFFWTSRPCSRDEHDQNVGGAVAVFHFATCNVRPLYGTKTADLRGAPSAKLICKKYHKRWTCSTKYEPSFLPEESGRPVRQVRRALIRDVNPLIYIVPPKRPCMSFLTDHLTDIFFAFQSSYFFDFI